MQAKFSHGFTPRMTLRIHTETLWAGKEDRLGRRAGEEKAGTQ